MVSSYISEISLKILLQISRPVIIRGKLSFLEPRAARNKKKRATKIIILHHHQRPYQLSRITAKVLDNRALKLVLLH